MTETSRIPASDIWSVRGIGVAESAITSTLSLSWRSSSFCLTPKRCSSSMISRPRSLRPHVAREQAVCADEDVHPALVEGLHGLARWALGERKRETCATVIG